MKHFSLPLICIVICWSCNTGGTSDVNPPAPDDKPTIEISPSQSSPVFEQNGGTASLSFYSETSWTVTVSEEATRVIPWITVSPLSGKAGNNSLTITVLENDSYDERNASVTIKSGETSESFTVTQKQKDALTVTSSKIEMPAEGWEAYIEVVANVEYEYEVEPSARAWLTCTGATRGLESSTLLLAVAPNGELEKREGRVTIRSGELSEVVTVYQDGAVPTLVLTQNEYTVGSEGGDIKVEVRSNTEYEVTLPPEGWITETETRAMSSHTHYFTISANDTFGPRTAEIVFADREHGIEEVVTVKQMQKDTIIVAQRDYTVEAEGGTLDITVEANVEFTVITSHHWIKQISTRGLSTRVLRFEIEENSIETERSGSVVLQGENVVQTITIKQAGMSNIDSGGDIGDMPTQPW